MATSFNTVPDTENAEPDDKKVPEWKLASQGIKLIINNNGDAAVKLFLKYPESLIMYSGYSFTVFMDALMTFEEDKLNLAITTLKEVEHRCSAEVADGWFKHMTFRMFGTQQPLPPKTLAHQLETQIILADSQVCLAILTFLQQDISGYFKGSWVLRKAWKVYQKVYREILQLYRDHVGEMQLPDTAQLTLNPIAEQSGNENENESVCTPVINGYKLTIPHSKSAYLQNGSTSFHHDDIEVNRNYPQLKKSTSINSALSHSATTRGYWSQKFSPFSFSSLSKSFTILSSSQDKLRANEIDKETIKRLMGAVSFGYGLFQLGISLLPPSLLRLVNIFGFGTDRQNGIGCLMYARTGVDMRAPLATLSLLWYHTIVRPFYAIDGHNVQAGAEAATQLLRETDEFASSALFLFFRGRICRLQSDIPSALKAFQQSVENATRREVKLLALHEVAWCHLIELNYCLAETTLNNLKSSSRWSKAFYTYLAAVCTASCQVDMIDAAVFNELRDVLKNAPRGPQMDEFLNKRAKQLPPNKHELSELKPIYCRLLLFEMLYLWNALPSCSNSSTTTIIEDCQQVENSNEEPMAGLAKLIEGCCYSNKENYDVAVTKFRDCIAQRQNIAFTAEDAHVSAFCHYELGSILIRSPETHEEGKNILQHISQYPQYDFDQRLNVRVHSLLRSC